MVSKEVVECVDDIQKEFVSDLVRMKILLLQCYDELWISFCEGTCIPGKPRHILIQNNIQLLMNNVLIKKKLNTL